MALAEDSSTARDGLRLRHPYLPQSEPQVFDEPGSYADPAATTRHNRSTEWAHGIAEVFMAVQGAGLVVESLGEHAEGFYPIVPGLVRGADGHWRFPEPHSGKFPLTFSLSARRPG